MLSHPSSLVVSGARVSSRRVERMFRLSAYLLRSLTSFVIIS